MDLGTGSFRSTNSSKSWDHLKGKNSLNRYGTQHIQPSSIDLENHRNSQFPGPVEAQGRNNISGFQSGQANQSFNVSFELNTPIKRIQHLTLNSPGMNTSIYPSLDDIIISPPNSKDQGMENISSMSSSTTLPSAIEEPSESSCEIRDGYKEHNMLNSMLNKGYSKKLTKNVLDELNSRANEISQTIKSPPSQKTEATRRKRFSGIHRAKFSAMEPISSHYSVPHKGQSTLHAQKQLLEQGSFQINQSNLHSDDTNTAFHNDMEIDRKFPISSQREVSPHMPQPRLEPPQSNVISSSPMEEDTTMEDVSVSKRTSNILMSSESHSKRRRTLNGPDEILKYQSTSPSKENHSPEKLNGVVQTGLTQQIYQSLSPAKIIYQSLSPMKTGQGVPLGSLSPNKAYQSTSPIKTYHSMSPSKNFQSVSPSKAFQSVSPSKAFQSVSPSKAFQSASPTKTYQSLPLKTFQSLSPTKSFQNTSPSKAIQSSSTSISVSPGISTSPSKIPGPNLQSSPIRKLSPSKNFMNLNQILKNDETPSLLGSPTQETHFAKPFAPSNKFRPSSLEMAGVKGNAASHPQNLHRKSSIPQLQKKPSLSQLQKKPSIPQLQNKASFSNLNSGSTFGLNRPSITPTLRKKSSIANISSSGTSTPNSSNRVGGVPPSGSPPSYAFPTSSSNSRLSKRSETPSQHKQDGMNTSSSNSNFGFYKGSSSSNKSIKSSFTSSSSSKSLNFSSASTGTPKNYTTPQPFSLYDKPTISSSQKSINKHTKK